MKRKEWWNKPMTRYNWFLAYVVCFFASMIWGGYMIYGYSIKKVAEKWKKQASDMLSDAKQRF